MKNYLIFILIWYSLLCTFACYNFYDSSISFRKDIDALERFTGLEGRINVHDGVLKFL